MKDAFCLWTDLVEGQAEPEIFDAAPRSRGRPSVAAGVSCVGRAGTIPPQMFTDCVFLLQAQSQGPWTRSLTASISCLLRQAGPGHREGKLEEGRSLAHLQGMGDAESSSHHTSPPTATRQQNLAASQARGLLSEEVRELGQEGGLPPHSRERVGKESLLSGFLNCGPLKAGAPQGPG